MTAAGTSARYQPISGITSGTRNIPMLSQISALTAGVSGPGPKVYETREGEGYLGIRDPSVGDSAQGTGYIGGDAGCRRPASLANTARKASLNSSIRNT